MNRAASLLVIGPLAIVALTGCSLKDMLAKADAGAASASADSGPSATGLADAASPVATNDAGNDAGSVTAKNAAAGTAKPRNALPTCAKGQVLATVAMSPFKPFCAPTCKTNADCKGVLCEDVNALGADGGRPKGPEFIKVCDPEAVATSATSAASAKPSASAPPATAAKCGPNQHFDDINKKCRAFGDCPAGFHWNDPMKSCINDG